MSEIIHAHLRMLRLLAVASIQGRCFYFIQELQIVWLLFEGGMYSKKYSMHCTQIKHCTRIKQMT